MPAAGFKLKKQAFGALWLLFCFFIFRASDARPASENSGPDSESAEIAVITSAETPIFLKASRAFEKALGRPVSRRLLRDEKIELGGKTRVVVTFGSRAAQENYPKRIMQVHCLATAIDTGDRNKHVYVSMAANPAVILAKMRAIQPDLRKVAVLWASEYTEDYVEEMVKAGAGLDIEVAAYKAENSRELGRILRKDFEAEAVWITPDPLLVNFDNFEILKRFSGEEKVPLYVPTESLAEKGAAVSISVGFEEMGRSAAEAVKGFLEGRPVYGIVYPEKVEIAVNIESARKCGIDISEKRLPGVRFIRER